MESSSLSNSITSNPHGEKSTVHKRKSKSGVPGRKRGWKKPEGKPKRPLSAYNLFFQDEKEEVQKQGKIGFAALARKIAEKWKTLDSEARSPYQARAEVEKARYKKEILLWEAETKRLSETPSPSEEAQYPVIQSNFPLGLSGFGLGSSPFTSGYFQRSVSLLGPSPLSGILAASTSASFNPTPVPTPMNFKDELDSVISEMSDELVDDPVPKPFEPLPLITGERYFPFPLSPDRGSIGSIDREPQAKESYTTSRSIQHLASVMDEECLDVMRSLIVRKDNN